MVNGDFETTFTDMEYKEFKSIYYGDKIVNPYELEREITEKDEYTEE